MRSAAYLGLAIFLLLVQSNLLPRYRADRSTGRAALGARHHAESGAPARRLSRVSTSFRWRAARSWRSPSATPQDTLSGAPIGLFTFVSVALWWLARVAGVRLTAQTALPRMSLALRVLPRRGRDGAHSARHLRRRHAPAHRSRQYRAPARARRRRSVRRPFSGSRSACGRRPVPRPGRMEEAA